MRVLTLAGVLSLGLTACGGDGGGTQPPTVASVSVSPATSPPALRTLGRTVQFSAQARDANAAVIPGITFTWSSSATGTATINAAGLLTAVANGTTEIRATAVPSGVQSSPVTVTVTQLADELQVTPASLAFGALGSTRQLAAAVLDSADFALPASTPITWSLLGPGTTASLSATGLVTALAVGTGDSAVATSGALSAKVPISVTQLAASIAVTADGPDTLRTTGRTRGYSAAIQDSNANPVPGLAPTWSSGTESVATISGGGVATAVADGTTQIQASVGAVIGTRALVVRRYAETFQLAPASALLDTPGATQDFTGTARDSVNTDLPIAWTSRAPSVASVSASTGASVTVTAVGNGSSFIVMEAGTRRDSAGVTVSGQVTAPLTAAVTVGDNFFRSVRNSTQNAAVDTVAVGGTVTWTWSAVNTHNVLSVLTPSFTSSPLQNSGTHAVTFGAAGTYEYVCQIHAQMTGRVVVRD